MKNNQSSTDSSQGKTIDFKREDGSNLLDEEEGKEVQYTKDYGVGVDVHKAFIQVNVLVKHGLSVIEFRKEFNTDWPSLQQAKSWILNTVSANSLPIVDASANFHYCIESTGTWHLVVLKAWGGSPSVINPTLARAGSRKTDVLDARTMSVSDLTGIWPTSYIPSIENVELRMLLDERSDCLKQATRIGNHINSSLLMLGINIGIQGSVTQDYNVRSKISAMLNNTTSDAVNATTDSEDTSYAILPPTIPDDVKCILLHAYEEYDMLQKLCDEYYALTLKKVRSMSWETADSTISGNDMLEILTTAPGIGNHTAILWLSRVITPRRFHNEKALAAYCGCDPSLKVSAGKVTSTVKRGGRKDLHSALCLAASGLMRRHSEPFGIFGYNIAMQTGVWKKGVSAVARKLAVAMYFMMLRAEPFSYEKYKMIHEPDVLNIPVETLVTLNPSFKRYLRYLIKNDIKDTKQLIHKYYICELPSIKGLGKNFFALVKDFINDQQRYVNLYERMINNEKGNS